MGCGIATRVVRLTLLAVLAVVLAPAAAEALAPPTPASVPYNIPMPCPAAQYTSSGRSAVNRLLLPAADASASDPLGTNPSPYFVDGPRHGYAAGAIATLLGLDPSSYPDSYSWAEFWQMVQTQYAAQLADPTLGPEIKALALIAEEPEPQRLSLYSGGGGPGAIESQTQKLLCGNAKADPGAIELMETFFIYPDGQYCPTLDEEQGNWDKFKRQIDELAQGTGEDPVVFLDELDSIGSSHCLVTGKSNTTAKNPPKQRKKKHHHKKRHHGTGTTHHAADGITPPDCTANQYWNTRLSLWECELRYELDVLSALPHTVVYTEGGYSDGNSVDYTAQVLNAIDQDVRAGAGTTNGFRGFYTNDTHNAWTYKEIAWADRVSAATHGLHYVVNTAQNGNGPDKQFPPGVHHGNEVLCNPPTLGVGPVPDMSVASLSAHLDALLWTFVPGRSSGTCNGGPAPGVFWPERAIKLAAAANARLGPTTNAPYTYLTAASAPF